MNGRRLLLGLVCWYSMAGGITRTRIQDTLFNANGTLANGTITLRWNGFTAVDGSAVVGNSATLRIINGVLQTDLAPSPSGTSYSVTYLLEGKSSYTETWVVPQSAAAVRLSQIRTLPPPAGGGSGGIIANIYAAGGNTGVGPTVFSPSSTLEVLDVSGVTRQVLRAGAGQGNNPLLSFHSGTGPHFVGFRVPPLSSSTTYTLPSQDGLPGNFLRTGR